MRSLAVILAVGVLAGCAPYQALSPGGEFCVNRCELSFFQCEQGGGGVWLAPVCGMGAKWCVDSCRDVARP